MRCTTPRIPRSPVIVFCAFLFLLLFGGTPLKTQATNTHPDAISDSPILLVGSFIDQNDRIHEILSSLEPAVSVQRIQIARMVDLQTHQVFAHAPVDLSKRRLLILEDAPLNALAQVLTLDNRSMLNELPTWVKQGGQLLIVGGQNSLGSYGEDSALEKMMPVTIEPDADGKLISKIKPNTVRAIEGEEVFVEHLHPVSAVNGEVWIKAGSAPLVVHGKVKEGSVTVVLSGAHGQWLSDQPSSTKKNFFDSQAWEQVILRILSNTFNEHYTIKRQEIEHGIHAYAYGAILNLGTLFPGQNAGIITLRTEDNQIAQRETVLKESLGNFLLSDTLRPGIYTLDLDHDSKQLSTKIRVGAPADPKRFEIRYSQISNSPSPYALAPNEAYKRAAELAAHGLTSTVFTAHPERPYNDRRAMNEIAAAGLEIIYYLSVRRNQPASLWTRQQFPLPLQAKHIDQSPAGWDVHDANFRHGIYLALQARKDDLNIPGLRAIQVIEEFQDGEMRSPSLKTSMHQLGLTGKEKPQDDGWLPHQTLRSDATAATFQHFRKIAQQFAPGIRQSSYWPASYWRATQKYTYRATDLANAVDELLGPGYGYIYNNDDPHWGWLSVARSTAEIFSSFGHGERVDASTYIYTQGRRLLNDTDPNLSTWRETIWTALARGANGLAYFALPPMEFASSLKDIHFEVSSYGNWIGRAPRRPASIAILQSWTTRTVSTDEQRERHDKCVSLLHGALSFAAEKIDFVREDQLDTPPEALKAIFVTETPFLQEGAFQYLTKFVERGGAVFLDSSSWAAEDPVQKTHYADRLERLGEATGRVHRIPLLASCTATRAARIPVSQYWVSTLRDKSLLPALATEDPETEIWVRGSQDVVIAVGVNHARDPREISFQPTDELLNFVWFDIRKNEKILSPQTIERLVPARDAFALLGVRKEAAKLKMTIYVSPNRFTFRTCGVDSDKNPVADGYPLKMQVWSAEKQDRISPGNNSRVTQGGCADWRISIPASDKSKHWTFTVTDPISGEKLEGDVEIPKYPPIL